MKILDRYIIKKFFVTYFFVVAILMAVIVVVDYTEKSDDFIKHNLSLGFILKEYYLVYIPTMANTLSPLAVFISVVFFTSKLASHTEIVAILSAGVSFRRFLMPYLFGATVLGIYTFFMVGWIIPKAAKKQIQFSVEYLKSPYYFELRDVHFKTGDSTYIYIQNYNNRVKTGYKFTLEKVGGVELLEKLSADKVVWDTVKQTWHIDKYKVHTFEGDKERAWAGNNMDTMLNISPKYFENDYKLEETMTLKELENYIREEVERGVGNVERFLNTKYERYAYPFAIIILTIMGVTISAKTRNQMLSLEALLFGAAGWLEDIETPDEYISQLIHEYNFLQHKFQLPENMISKSEWKLLRLRPANFPTIRLAQLAAFLAQNESLFSRIIYCKDLEELKKLFSTPQSDYWRKHYLIGKKASKEIPAMGVSSKSILMINTIVSLLFAYGIQKDNEDYKQKALLFLSQLKPEKNNITKKWEGLNWKAKNAFESQGQIELLNNYCKAKKCLDCKIGNEILSNCN